MNTFEIITLAEEFKSMNDGEATSIEVFVKAGQWRVIANKLADPRYWDVKVGQWLPNEAKWAVDYVCTKSLYSMRGAISEAIDAVIDHIEI